MISQIRNWYKYLIIDFLIYTIIFLAIIILLKRNINWSSIYVSMFIPFIGAGAFATIFTRKFSFNDNDYSPSRVFYSFILMLGFIASFSFFVTAVNTPRFILISSLFLSFVVELIWMKVSVFRRHNIVKISKKKTSLKVFIFNFILLTSSLYDYLIYHTSTKFFGLQHLLLLGIYLGWYISSKITFNFYIKASNGYWRFIWSFIKSYILLFAITFFLIFFLRLQQITNYSAVSGIFLYSFISFIVYTFKYYNTRQNEIDAVTPRLFRAPVLDFQELETKLNVDYKYSINGNQFDGVILEGKLRDTYLKSFPSLFERISSKIEFSGLDFQRSVVLRSRDEYNVEILPKETLHLFINLHQLNDIRRLNSYLISVNSVMSIGGVFIGKFEPIKNRYKRFLESYPTLIGKVFYFFDFVWRRVIPKIPVMQKIYFGITQGIDRALSFAECLGRLYFCGFRVFDVYEIDNFVYFIAIKIKRPSSDKNPSYGPLFKMRRIGKDGKDIFVYKMRTMHPYSEYLQKFMYDYFGSDTGDKVNNDFRVTFWGNYFRKFWIDELPMLINFLRGELKIVGVRPLSAHKFGMYPEELQNYRTKFKPGLIPPYYADLPKNFEELINSEIAYLRNYEKNPLLTDLKYFSKAVYNITIKNARSA